MNRPTYTARNAAAFDRLRTLKDDNEGTQALMAALRPRFAAYATRHEDGTAPQAIAAHQLFQTPPALASRLAALVPSDARTILEPSAGLGRILDALNPAANITAVEINPDCAAVLYKQARPNVTLLQRDFLTVQPDTLPQFDAVAMNPPFTRKSDLAHILHALTFLRTGGALVAICMDTPHREKALRHLADHWEPIPAGAFRSEGTETATVLLRITKA